jgi:hypothetical protein
VNRAARNTIPVAGSEHLRRLSLYLPPFWSFRGSEHTTQPRASEVGHDSTDTHRGPTALVGRGASRSVGAQARPVHSLR